MKSVEILKGEEQPIQIIVKMDIFQIESFLQKKIETFGIEDNVVVVAYVNDQELKRLQFDKVITVLFLVINSLLCLLRVQWRLCTSVHIDELSVLTQQQLCISLLPLQRREDNL